jgi:hypothetical protein
VCGQYTFLVGSMWGGVVLCNMLPATEYSRDGSFHDFLLGPLCCHHVKLHLGLQHRVWSGKVDSLLCRLPYISAMASRSCSLVLTTCQGPEA